MTISAKNSCISESSFVRWIYTAFNWGISGYSSRKRDRDTFSSVDIALRLHLGITSSNATGERSFSVLKGVKNYLRNSTSDYRLSSIAFLATNQDLVLDMDYDTSSRLQKGS